MEISDEANLISVHGREGLYIRYKRKSEDEDGVITQDDISESTIYFEVPRAPIRKLLISDPDDALGLLITLTREEVATLSSSPMTFATVDETGVLPEVEWEGKIVRTGYTVTE